MLAAYPNLLDYARELYQLPGASLSVDMAHIRAHYYGWVGRAYLYMCADVVVWMVWFLLACWGGRAW